MIDHAGKDSSRASDETCSTRASGTVNPQAPTVKPTEAIIWASAGKAAWPSGNSFSNRAWPTLSPTSSASESTPA